MPKYKYKCNTCEAIFEFIHSMKERIHDCESCKLSNVMERVPYTVRVQKVPGGKEKPGSVVRRFIEEAKEEVKSEKAQYKKKEHK